MQPFTINTEHTCLRPLTESDILQISKNCQDTLIQKWTTIPVPYTLDDAKRYFELTEQW